MRNLLKKVSNKKRGGFTLVEILVVILIIGILAITLIPKIGSSTLKAQETGVKTRFNEFRTASTMLLKENAGFKKIMNSDDDVNTVAKFLNGYLDPAVQFDLTTVQGQYCNSHAKDPWNNVYRLYVSADHSTGEGTITFMSYGPSGNTANAEEFNRESAGADYTLSVKYEAGVITVNSEGIDADNGGNGGNNGNNGNNGGNGSNEGNNGGNGNEPGTGGSEPGTGGTNPGTGEPPVTNDIVSGTGTIVTLGARSVTIEDVDTGVTYRVDYINNCPSVGDYAEGTEGTYTLNNTTEELISFVPTPTGVTISGIGQFTSISSRPAKVTIVDEVDGKSYTAEGSISTGLMGEYGSYSITNGQLDFFNVIEHYGWASGNISAKGRTYVFQDCIVQVKLDGTIYDLSSSSVTINGTRYQISKNCEGNNDSCAYCANVLASVPTGDVWYKVNDDGQITVIDSK